MDAIATLAAVIVGGAITYFGQSRLDERRTIREDTRERERADREREREEAADAAELRVAMRLLLDELDTIALHFAMLATEGRYPLKVGPDGQSFLFPTEVWETYKPTLARGVTDSAWEALAPFMHGIPRARAIVAEAEPDSQIEPELIEQFRKTAIAARDLYEGFADEPAPSVNERGELT